MMKITPVVKQLLIINIIFFIGSQIVPASEHFLALFFPENPSFRVWQPITHMFMHGGFAQLVAGRIDVFPIDKTVAFDMLHQHFSAAERAQLTFNPKPLRSDTLHLMLSRAVPGNAELIARFNNGLKQLRDSGKIAQYLMEAQQPLSLAP